MTFRWPVLLSIAFAAIALLAVGFHTDALGQNRPSDMPRGGYGSVDETPAPAPSRRVRRFPPVSPQAQPESPAALTQEVVIKATPTRFDVIKLVHAKQNAPTHQILFHGPRGDYRVAGNPREMARSIFGDAREVNHPDDLVSRLAANGWEPFSHEVVIYRGNDVHVDREYWMLRRPMTDED